MSIVKKSVNSTSVEAIAEIETVTNDTKILADIGMIKGVIEKNNVHFFIKKPINQEKYLQEEVEARVTEEAGAEPEVKKVKEVEKEVEAE